MKYTYDALVDFWNAESDGEELNLPEARVKFQAKKFGTDVWVQKLNDDLFCLSWRHKGATHTWVYVYRDGSFQCCRFSSRIRCSESCLKGFFGHQFEFKAKYPEVLGIRGQAENLICVWTDSTGQPIDPPRYWKSQISYEQLAAALACQVLHYSRLRGHPQPKVVRICRKPSGFKIWPGRYRELASALKALFAEVGMLTTLEYGEVLSWDLPDLEPIEAELKELAGELGRPSTRHLPASSAYYLNMPRPYLDSFDFFGSDSLRRHLGGNFVVKTLEDRVQIVHRPTEALLIEVCKDRTLVLWDVGSSYARKVHGRFDPSLRGEFYEQQRVCYLRLPNLDLFGPVFNGCRLCEGVCLNPLKLWSDDLRLEDLGWQLRRVLVEWFVEKVAKLVKLDKPFGLTLEITFFARGVQVYCPDLLWLSEKVLPEEVRVEIENLPKLLEVWYAERLRPYLFDSLVAHFACQLDSVHDMLVLLENS